MPPAASEGFAKLARPAIASMQQATPPALSPSDSSENTESTTQTLFEHRGRSLVRGRLHWWSDCDMDQRVRLLLFIMAVAVAAVVILMGPSSVIWHGGALWDWYPQCALQPDFV